MARIESSSGGPLGPQPSPVADTNSAPLPGEGQGGLNVAAAGTPQQLEGASTPCSLLYLTARTGNTKNIAWGFTNAVRATAAAEIGAVLTPGEPVVIPVSNVQNVWIDATVSGEGVSFSYL
jgi:hypothetical protein